MVALRHFGDARQKVDGQGNPCQLSACGHAYGQRSCAGRRKFDATGTTNDPRSRVVVAAVVACTLKEGQVCEVGRITQVLPPGCSVVQGEAMAPPHHGSGRGRCRLSPGHSSGWQLYLPGGPRQRLGGRVGGKAPPPHHVASLAPVPAGVCRALWRTATLEGADQRPRRPRVQRSGRLHSVEAARC